ncbi:MAG: hypothetical protein ABGZ17_26680, partial [Planctomycetaceae bacterium]
MRWMSLLMLSACLTGCQEIQNALGTSLVQQLSESGADSVITDENGEIVSVTFSERANDGTLAHLVGLQHLRELDLGHSQITDSGLRHLQELHSLESLWMHETKISDAGLKHIKSLTNIWSLTLAGTKIGDAGLTEIQGLQKLEVLNLRS